MSHIGGTDVKIEHDVEVAVFLFQVFHVHAVGSGLMDSHDGSLSQAFFVICHALS